METADPDLQRFRAIKAIDDQLFRSELNWEHVSIDFGTPPIHLLGIPISRFDRAVKAAVVLAHPQFCPSVRVGPVYEA